MHLAHATRPLVSAAILSNPVGQHVTIRTRIPLATSVAAVGLAPEKIYVRVLFAQHWIVAMSLGSAAHRQVSAIIH